MRLGAKFALIGAAGVMIAAVALVALAVWQSRQYNQLAQREVEVLINADLDHITQGIYNLVRTENEAVQQQVDYNLNVAQHVLDGAGEMILSRETIPWTAVNQFTEKSEIVTLPKLLVGGEWLGQNADLNFETPIVDEVTRLVGETATVFQRMNEKGDMLRVATTVQTLEGKRAIGTYIPAVNPDGVENPVISTILKGETYHGRAYVVNAWYLTAYAPLTGRDGTLVGMIYVGVKQKTVEARVSQAILQTKVGRTGYVYVLGGGGESRGRYIISDKGERNGEDVWSSQDSDGHYVIQEIITTAKGLKPGEMATVRYRWQNPGEAAPRWKIARLAYYAPWDWVIGTSVHEDELQAYSTLLSDGRLRMTRIMGLAGVLITVLIGVVFIPVTLKITRPIRQMTLSAERISRGDLDQVVEVSSRDEIGILARTFNLMTSKLRDSMEGLRKSEENYRLIFENALEGFLQSSLEGALLSANPAMAEMLGYASPEELIAGARDLGREVYLNPDDRDAMVATLLEEGKVAGFETRFKRKDGTGIWVSISARMVYDSNGKPLLIEGFISDINDQKEAEEEKKRLEAQLTQAQKMEAIGTLAGGIAHDFNNILSAIIGYTELALDDLAETDKAREELHEVLKSSDRARDLVKQILTFSRMAETEFSPISLCTVVKEALKMLRSIIPSNIDIRQDLAASGLVMSAPTQINQIVMNLCTNAVHALDESGGILEVALTEVAIERPEVFHDFDISPGTYLKLAVRDNGKGIPPEIVDRIFEPYFTTKEMGRGTGLGLSVIHGIIRSHHGAITCRSVPDEGTTFEVYLPRIISEVQQDGPVAEGTLPVGHERILFVDDEPSLVRMGVEMLSRNGYAVVDSLCSMEALELFRGDPQGFDLVITDMTMPEMTGDRLALELIKIRHDIPIIMCTGYNEHISEKRAKEIGIRAFLTKPFDMRSLAEHVRRVLDDRKRGCTSI